ncbi:Alpha/Beta hydrolase protein [Astrocystis sublimbata]|nr:Alpha/Beta hydrolase protein [Astrocystis sublimbata]
MSVAESFDMMTTAATYPTAAEVAKTDAYPGVTWRLEPHSEGETPVAAGRGGPFKIHWEVHGDGPVKLIFVNGLGVVKASWQRQTMHFGHVHGDKYSVLILDNRGMGRSERPFMRYSTSSMAADVIEILDHLSWTDERQLHICGISMGGMIAQELACVAPHRIASLNLICTAAAIENTASFSENLINRATMLLPKSLDRTIAYTAANVFPPDWLSSPDDAEVPTPSTPRCAPPANGWPYQTFSSNYARFAAQEVAKNVDKVGFTRQGFLLQIIAAGWHHKSEAQLREMADKVGRERILIIHGTVDKVISCPHGRKLIEYIQPGKSFIVDGMGHAPIVERTQWFNELISGMCTTGEKFSGR